MQSVYIVVNVDSDPDPVIVPQSDAEVLAKYETVQRILDEYTGGAAAFSVHTSPKHRERFFNPPFADFWHRLVAGGGDLILHPEEDLYGPPEGQTGQGCTYEDTGHMFGVIHAAVDRLRAVGLAFSGYRGGYHGFTPQIGRLLQDVGIGIDLSCAPGIAWPNKCAAWSEAPLSAYYMSNTRCDQPASSEDEQPIFEIPFGYDCQPFVFAGRYKMNEHYLVNEFSTLEEMIRVWDTIRARSEDGAGPTIISMICHTFPMHDAA